MRMDNVGSQLGGLVTKLGLLFLAKEFGKTQLAPPDPIFFTQAVKNNPHIQCLAMKDFSNLQNIFHVELTQSTAHCLMDLHNTCKLNVSKCNVVFEWCHC